MSNTITLRDHFAGLAMQSFIIGSNNMDNVAQCSYDQADAMIAERNKHQMNKNLDLSVTELGLTVRTVHCLLAEDIKHVRDLVSWSQVNLLKTPNFGKKSLCEIIEVLATLDLKIDRVNKRSER